MPKYEVMISNNKAYSAEIEVEADDENEARRKVEQLMEIDKESTNPEISWLLEEDDFTIDDVNEIDAEDEDDDDEVDDEGLAKEEE